jgi:peroxin-5
MRQLRDGEVAVEGDKVVEQVQPYSSTASKGKARADGWASDFAATLSSTSSRQEEGRVGEAPPVFNPAQQSVEQFAQSQHDWAARQAQNAQVLRDLQEGYSSLEGLWDDEDRARAAREGKGKERAREDFHFQGDGGRMEEDAVMDTHVPLAQASWEEDLDDPAFIAGGHAPPGLAARSRTAGTGPSAQQSEWDVLQRDWDDFAVTATGLQPKNAPEASTSSTAHGYSFAQNNPYIARHHPVTSHHHAFHDQSGHLASALYDRHDSLLQHEANVQQNPSSASAWLELGLKQQQNEREELAIAALRRAVELDPSVANGGAHLGLAVSFTNEGRRYEAYEEIDRWISTLSSSSGNRGYANEISQYRNLLGSSLPQGMKERLDYLSGLLIRLAQNGAEAAGGIDADVQVALGVLFNSSEEYEKAGDCFQAALSVRPDVRLLLFPSLLLSFHGADALNTRRTPSSSTASERPTPIRGRRIPRFSTTTLHWTSILGTCELGTTLL